MIHVIATFAVSSDQVDRFIETAQPLVSASRAENGNISYELLRSREEPTRLTFLETWRDDAALQAHSASQHFTTIISRLLLLAEGEPSIVQYVAA
ncbi:antibiotic biosynthesis monooxygenase [Actinomyces sp. 2119]|uniref:Antibiotic biosynthesis monooxygenase n=1 Tax=Actinomyces lilanjuaniae TaxID=2321394 RepID=A0ABN5PTD7_9ACTO|nr:MULTISPECIES: putative quinol monooxygenase [Actinomyces]AYD90529.1 antibiotic biosynthesis monooxygenase [Actinomyces lilanjuaniae]RJF44019.1 antibiotic biosynthesis monooxygenase [Actinomyces sp. 2119]